MSLSFRLLPSLLALVLLAAVSASAVAAPQRGSKPPKDDQTREQADRRGPKTDNRQRRNEDALSDSIRRVEQTTRGQVLSAERVPYEGRNINRIKVVDDRGRVRVYMDDPQQSRKRGGKPPTRDDDD